MRWSLFVAVALLDAAAATSTPLLRRWHEYELKHGWVEVPKGWELHDAAPADHLLDLSISLKQDKFEELVSHLYEVSDPSNARYGAHLSKAQVEELVAPHPDTVDLVSSWLDHHGIDIGSCHRTPSGDTIKVTVPVRQAEQMLNTKYHVFHNPQSSDYIVRTMNYSLPSVLMPHVTLVTPTTYFGNMRKMKATSHLTPETSAIGDLEALVQQLEALHGLATVPSSCTKTITPTCLRALYNSSTYVPQATKTNVMGICGYLDEFANFADLQTFFQKFRTDAVGGNFTVVDVNGGANTQNDPGVEANLDIQYAEGMNFPTPNVYFSTAGSPPFIPDSETPTNTNEPYLDFLNFILNQTTVPQTFSTSYGDDEQTVPLDFATTVCNGFAQLGARGVSIMFSSGDDGVGGGSCTSNDGTNAVKFQPNFPASCPYVTTVGATTKIGPEVAVSFSGGGFSNYFVQPSYQTTAVSTFLNGLGKTNAGLFNTTGRAYPDVSAQGENFQVIVGGRTESVAGTSASSPTFAGVVTLLNDFRISIGKPPLGFLNPLLYSSGAAGLNDITSGSNPGCKTNGFTAGKGWDPVTGLGTPDFGKLQAIVENI